MFDPHKNASFFTNSANGKVFAIGTHCVFRDGVAKPVYRYQGFFPGGTATGEVS